MKFLSSNKNFRLITIQLTVTLLFTLLPLSNTSAVQLRNNTNALELWKYTEENEVKIGTWSSLIQSFIIIFVSEIADKTFIIILIFSAKNEKFKVFTSSFIAMLLMNFISIMIGYSVHMLLYKNIIDWVVFLSLLFYGVSLIAEARDISERQEDRYVALMKDEIGKTKKRELKKYMRETATTNTANEEGRVLTVADEVYQESMPTLDNREPLHEPLITKEGHGNQHTLDLKTEFDEENQNENGNSSKYFWFIFSSTMTAECGDRSQVSTIAISAVFNIYGVIIGSSLALLLSVWINVNFGKELAKVMKEKHVNYLCGYVLTLCAVEIMLIKFALYF